MWLHHGWGEAPISSVSSAHTAPGKGRSACSLPIGLQAPPPMGDTMDLPCQAPGTLPH